ncbi:uncharacterized protein A4U43_C10F5680 [Asparagus officinalis]|uniref:Protein CHROMATIN REMODELING 24 n=1 Tax=Asparagus officinalis TaxID=4686 RepID=A0A5P1E0Y9_ASPOF|nr:protein CHROMATIN REMODELING 24 [Asparagus officinalis]ONK56252.1 uncharacterized protein A4U43_C10F5680 [Asparagus officinalis]
MRPRGNPSASTSATSSFSRVSLALAPLETLTLTLTIVPIENLKLLPFSEIKARKVKLEGHRRLCKLKSPTRDDNDDDDLNDELCDSPVREKENDRRGENIRDILDDLSFRLESLSVEKPKARPRPASGVDKMEPLEEFKSAPSSPSVSSDEKGKGKGKGFGSLVLDDDDDDECVVLGSNRKEKVKEGEFGDSLIDVFDDDDDDDGDNDDIVMDWAGGSKNKRYVLPGNTAKMLYPHQREGLKWFWSLHCAATGGILGDDMGLGKTMQVAAFLSGLFHSHLIMRVLIVAPKTLIAHWMKELSVVGLSGKIRDYSGASPKVRDYELQYILQDSGILLTTYDIVRNNFKSIRGDRYVYEDGNEDNNLWDYVVLDEGHIIKNPKTQRAQSLLEIPCVHRIIISGTPIQNNLKELWALFHFCCPAVLGDKDEFKVKYENKILRGNDKHASDREKYVGSTVAKELRNRIKPYFLRRLKSEVFVDNDDASSAKLSKKHEMIVWLKLTTCQRQLYEAFLKSDWVHSSMDGGSPLAALTILKKICDHPLLLTKKAAEGVLEGMDEMLNHDELGMVEQMAKNLANITANDDVQQLDHNVSCKILFIMTLLDNLLEEGHIVLIFSQTRKMLNLIQEAIISAGYKYMRIDGTTKVSDRERTVKEFQEGSGAPIFLLTSQVGGLGLTLTKADRVIVVDPAWNPSTDNQSVDRAYRIGQKRDVIVYRLMTCGTIEEKIYKMQVFKGGLFRTATEQKEQMRYFSQKDIREIFSLPKQGFDISITQQELFEEHGQQHDMDASLKCHIEFLERQGIAGVSHHSLLFSKNAIVPFVPENNEVHSKPVNRIFRTSPSGSSLELAVDGAHHAFKPKEFATRVCPASSSANEGDSPEIIEDRIKRLSQTLANKALVSRLPDSGGKIKKQIEELNTQLHELRNPVLKDATEKKEPAVVDVDDLTKDLQNVLSV